MTEPVQPTTDLGRPYAERVAAAGPLGRDLWAAVKHARDEAFNRAVSAQAEYQKLDAMLTRMRDAGLAAHLPTIEEVQEGRNGR